MNRGHNNFNIQEKKMIRSKFILKVSVVLIFFSICLINNLSSAGLTKTGMSTYEIENENEIRNPHIGNEKTEEPTQDKPKSPYGDHYDPDNPYGEWEK